MKRLGYQVALLLAGWLLILPTEAVAQCDSGPRLLAPTTACQLGEPCELAIELDADGADIASLATTLDAGGAIECEPGCAEGPAAPNGSCGINAATCRFNVADLSTPITAFSDGDVATVTVTCSVPGAHSLDLLSVSLGEVTGNPVAGCGSDGMVLCQSGSAPTQDVGIDSASIADACGDSAADTITIAQVGVGSQANRVLVVGVGAEENDGDCDLAHAAAGATYGGIEMTAAVAAVSDLDSWRTCNAIFYLLDPPTGTADVVVTFPSSTSSAINHRQAGAILLYDAAQEAPHVVAAHGSENDGSPVDNAVAGVIEGAAVVDIFTTGNAGSFTATQSGQEVAWQRSCGTGSSASSTTTASTGGSVTAGWTHTDVNRYAHALAAFGPAARSCNSAADCDDGEACTLDLCIDGICANDGASLDGQACDDGAFCNGADSCSDGACVGAGDPCAGGPPCADICDESADTCLVTAGVACNDGLACTAGETCDGFGSCSGADLCANGSTCSAASGDCEDSDAEALLEITPAENIDGSTFSSDSFAVTNTSPSGQRIVGLRLMLDDAFLPDLVYDPDGTAGDAAAKCLTPNSGKVETGFVEVADRCVDPFLDPYHGGFRTLDLSFADFEPGETFTFSVDIDPSSIQGASSGPAAGVGGSISGLELSGARVEVAFDDGSSHGGNLHRVAGSDGGSYAIVRAGQPAAPAIGMLATPALPVTVIDPDRMVRVTGPAGAEVRVLTVEGGLDVGNAPGGGFDVEPFEANTALVVQETFTNIGPGGTVDVPVTLTRTSTTGGINHILAVVEDPDGSGRNGRPSSVLVVELGGPCQSAVDCGAGRRCTQGTCETACTNNSECGGAAICIYGGCNDLSDDTDNDGMPDASDPCPFDPRNLCFGPIASDLVSGKELRINANTSPAHECAGSRIDCNGDLWHADFGYNVAEKATLCNLDGGGESCVVAGITGLLGCDDESTEDLFQCGHSDNPADPELAYGFAVANGDYLVNLYFANTYTGSTAVGDRVFDIVVEGATAYADFDQVAAAGGSGRAVVRSTVASVADGMLDIELIHGPVENPAIKAIEVRSLPECEVDADCDDGSVCTGSETCQGQLCFAGTPLICDDGVFCNGAEVCDALAGCQVGADPCDDGLFCNGAETCDAVAGCQPGTYPCDDGVFCNGAEVCDEADGCQPGVDPCDDGDACNGAESCNAVDGCGPGTPPQCDDGLWCNGAESCDPAIGCVEGTPPDFDDAVACTIDSCNEATRSPVHLPSDAACSDNLYCSGKETCHPTQGCQPAAAIDCGHLDSMCGAAYCDEDAGSCAVVPMAEGQSCVDGDVCTVGDTCTTGYCVGTPQSTAASVKLRIKRKNGPANDKLKITARMPLGQLTMLPDAGGSLIDILDDFQSSIYAAYIPPEAFVDVKGDAINVRYKDNSESVPTANRLRSLSVRRAPIQGIARVRAKMSGTEVPLAADTPFATLKLAIGTDPGGSCLSAYGMICDGTERRLSCHYP